MPQVVIDWSPNTKPMGDYYFLRATDGDTPYIELPVRMLSIDTAEVHYSNQTPMEQQPKLSELKSRLQAGEFNVLPAALRSHLRTRLDSQAGRRQYVQGLLAEAEFEDLLRRELRPPNRHERKIFVLTSGERFDHWGRLLGYLAKYLSPAERKKTQRNRRQTFNLQMVALGWAAPMPIYPSLPRKEDLERIRKAARRARQEGRGIWEDAKTLLAYEYRMCIKMHRREPIKEYLPRYCADVTTKLLYPPERYLEVDAENRLFIWRVQKDDAVRELDLTEV